MEKTSDITPQSSSPYDTKGQQTQQTVEVGETTEQIKRPWWHSVKEPGSALQIVIAAVIAIAIGLAVTGTVDEVPDAAPTLIEIPGVLWLRALKAVGKTGDP